MADIDSLSISIESNADNAVGAIDRLVQRLED